MPVVNWTQLRRGKKALKVVGLDISTRTGLAVLKPPAVGSSPQVVASHELTGADQALSGKLLPGTEPSLKRARSIGTQVITILERNKPDLVVVEGYGFASRSLAGLVEIGTIIRYLVWKHSHRWVTVSPTQLKKFATGKGNTKKDQLRLEVFKRWGFEASSDNEIDAYVLAAIGLALHDRLPKLTSAQRAVVAALQAAKEGEAE